MRRLLLALALCLAPAIAAAQTISLGQTPLGGGGTALWADGTEVLTFAGNPAANSLVCPWVGFAGLTASGITSVTGLGGSWTTPVTTNQGSGAISFSCSCDPAGAAAAITVNSAVDASANVRYGVVNFTQSGGSGFDCSSIHTASNAANTASSPHASGTATPATANNVCFGFIKGSSGTYTVEAGWTNIPLNDDARGAAGYLIQSSATGQSFDPTTLAAEDRAVGVFCVDSLGGGGGGGTPARMPWPNWIGGAW